ncbi:hypothetical protein GF373_07685 [bacterium]|nr:hypothetical protein [bacterium]
MVEPALKPFKPIPKHKPDWMERSIRFGCGALFGSFLALGGGIYTLADGVGVYLIAIIVAALIFGFLTMLLGDKLWDWWMK